MAGCKTSKSIDESSFLKQIKEYNLFPCVWGKGVQCSSHYAYFAKMDMCRKYAFIYFKYGEVGQCSNDCGR